tara:strand:- start:2507 stop:3103 length:597 start_codon:yes stop_codon:yes gene_type:complete
MRRRQQKQKAKLILPIFIAFILIASIFGVMIGGLYGGDKDYEKYNGIFFKKTTDGRQTFSVDGANYNILYGPNEVKGFGSDVPEDFLSDIVSVGKMYLDISDEKAAQGIFEIYSNFNGKLNIVLSCPPENKDAEQCKNLPLRSCEDVDGNTLIMLLSFSEKKNIDYTNGCFEMSGSEGYLAGVSDYIVMTYAGVYDEQ